MQSFRFIVFTVFEIQGRKLNNNKKKKQKNWENKLFVISSLLVMQFLLENKKIFELKNEGYRDGIKRKETR